MDIDNDPFALLSDLAARSVAGARGLPQQLSAQVQWSGIGFLLNGQHCVVPMKEVAEMLERPQATRIPGVKPWVKGVANVRGRLLPLIDLEAFFGNQSTVNRKKQRVLVMDVGEFYCGVIVDEVMGMQHFPLSSFSEEANSDVQPRQAAYTKGSYQHNDKHWTVFSLYELAKDPDFFHVAVH